MAWEENPRICLHMQLIAILSRTGVKNRKTTFSAQGLSTENSLCACYSFFLLYDNPATRLLWPLATNHVVFLHPLKMLRYSTPVDIQSVGHFARSDTCLLGYKLQNGLSSFWSTFLVHLACFWSTFLLSLFFFECEVIIHRFLVLRETRQVGLFCSRYLWREQIVT